MTKLSTMLTVLFCVFTISSVLGAAASPFPTKNLTNDERMQIVISDVSYNEQKKLVMRVLLINKDAQSFDFSLGNCNITVVNSKSQKKEEWRSAKIFAKDRSRQRQPGSGTIVLPPESETTADIVYDGHVGPMAERITGGTMNTHTGAYAIPELPTPATPKAKKVTSSPRTPAQPRSVLPKQISTDNAFMFQINSVKMVNGKMVLMIKLHNKTTDVFEYYPASTVLQVFNKKSNRNEEWQSQHMSCTTAGFQRQMNGAIAIPAKKSAMAQITFNGHYGPDVAKILSGTVYYESNTRAGSQEMVIPEIPLN